MRNIRNIEKMADGAFIYEVEDSALGWIYSSASPSQPDELELYDEIQSGKHGAIGTYIAPQRTRSDVEIARKSAYANPHTGSDRLFAEAQRMQLMGETDWEAVRDQAVARFEEIKAQHPWPAEEEL